MCKIETEPELTSERSLNQKASEIIERFFDAIHDAEIETVSFVAHFVAPPCGEDTAVHEHQDQHELLRKKLIGLVESHGKDFAYTSLDTPLSNANARIIAISDISDNVLIEQAYVQDDGRPYAYNYEVWPLASISV